MRELRICPYDKITKCPKSYYCEECHTFVRALKAENAELADKCGKLRAALEDIADTTMSTVANAAHGFEYCVRIAHKALEETK